MEAELSVLRGQERDLTTAELRRRLATLNCQMKKEQAIVRRYQVATEKLLHFAEVNITVFMMHVLLSYSYYY